jgi:hypothetical protein
VAASNLVMETGAVFVGSARIGEKQKDGLE